MQEEILETTLNGDNIIETEITAVQKDMVTDHSQLTHLDYENSGHTGFQPAGNYIEDENYTHTDNNYTDEEKTKLAGLSNYDDTEIRGDISNLQSTKADKTELSSKQDTITSNNKLSSDLIDDTNKTNKFVTSQEKTTWNAKSDFSGSYNDLTDKPTLFSGNYNDLSNKPTIPDELSDLSDDSTHRLVTDTEKSTWNNKSDFSGSYEDLTNKPTIPVVPTNISSFTNDSGYLVSGDLKTINSQSIVGSGDITISGGSSNYNDLTNKPIKVYEINLTGVENKSAEMKTLFTQILNDINDNPNFTAILTAYGGTTSPSQYQQIFLLTRKWTYSNKYYATFYSLDARSYYATGDIPNLDYYQINANTNTSKTDIENLSIQVDSARSFTKLSKKSVGQYALVKDNTTSYTPTADYHPATKKYVDDNAGGADIQINGTSIVSSNVANIVTNTAYDSSTNKIATMSDITSAIGTALNGNY